MSKYIDAYLCPLLWFLLLVCMTCPQPSLAGEPASLPPGSTILSAAEYDYPPFSDVTERGRATGFSVELLEAVLQTMGHKVNFAVGPWSEVKQSLIDRKVQVLPLVGRTPEREQYFDFTFPYMNLHGTIMVREGQKDIVTLADLKGRKVAVLKGDNAEEFLRRSQLGAEIITTASFESALRDLSKGQYDAVVIQKLLAMQLIQKGGINKVRSVGPPLEKFVQSFCFAVPKGQAALLSILNEGLSIVIADGTFKQLRNKWFAALEKNKRSRIVVGGDSNYPPYEYLDENGNPAGFNVDLTRAIAGRLQLDIDIQLDIWQKTRAGLTSGRIDLVQGMFYSAERDVQVDFSPAHAIVGHSIVSRTGSNLPQTMSGLIGKSIIVMAGDIMHDVAIKHGYEQQLVLVGSQEEALRLLSAGKHDCVLMARNPALYLIRKNGLDNLQVGAAPVISPEYCYAVQHGNEALLAQFSDTMNILKQSGEYREIYGKWFGAFENPVMSSLQVMRSALYAAIPVLLILIVVVVWNKILKKQVVQRTAQLRKEMAEREILEEQLRHAEKMQAIGQLAGGIAHDFNNQLSGILGFATLLGKKLTDQKQLSYLEKIRQSAQRAADLTQQLLAFSRRGKNLATATDMEKIIEDVASILQHSIDKKISITSQISSAETMVLGDPNQLQNALLNVALNARDAISGSGSIEFFTSVEVLAQADCDRTAWDVRPGRYLKIGVIDDGSGMDAKTQSRIFEPFFTTKEVGKGTGMGLASVYGTITEHQGMIHISSKLGKGTSFCIYLPLTEELSAEQAAVRTDEPACGQGHILVVDDEEDVREVAAGMLEDLGYRVTLCKDGPAAMEFYRKSWLQVDLVILDMMMPVLSGKETFMAMQRVNPQIRAVVVSGFSLNEQVQEVLDLGAIDYLGKPFGQIELSRTLANAFKLKVDKLKIAG